MMLHHNLHFYTYWTLLRLLTYPLQLLLLSLPLRSAALSWPLSHALLYLGEIRLRLEGFLRV